MRSFNTTLITLFKDNPGLNKKSKKQFIQRFEINYVIYKKSTSLLKFSLTQRKIINMYLSQLISINNNIFELIKYNLVRLYLIKTFKGRCHALGKPAHGQRT